MSKEEVKIDFVADYNIEENKEYLIASKNFFIAVAKATGASTHAQLGDFIERAMFCVLKVRGSILKEAESAVVRESKQHAAGASKNAQFKENPSFSSNLTQT